MSDPVNFTTGVLSPSCFASEQDRFEAYIAALTGEVDGTIQWQTSQTAPSDTNLYWLKQYQGQSAPQTILKWSQSDGAWTRIGEIPTFSGTSTGTAGAYQIINSPPYTQNSTAYEIGKAYTFIANHASTGASTLQVDGLAVKPMKINVSSDLQNNTILANEIVTAIYDGTNFQIIHKNVLSIQVSDLPPGTDGQTLRTRSNPSAAAIWETSIYSTPTFAYASIPAAGSTASFAHGLTVKGSNVCPIAFGAKLVCVEDDSSTGYVKDDEANVVSSWDTDNESRDQFFVWANTTTVNVMLVANASTELFIPKKSDGVNVNVNGTTKWKIKAWAMV